MMDEHSDKALMENVEFLLDVGLHKDQIARRLGMTRKALDNRIAALNKRSKRAGERVLDPADGEAAGQDEGPGSVPPLRIAYSERRVAPPQE